MLYTLQTKLALDIAYRAHHGQLDKGGSPYIFHPFHLADQMDTETEVTAALLHDVLEDTPLTESDLRQAGISEEVLRILALLTHPKEEPYLDYIRRVSEDHTARKIKLEDLRHNSDLSRLPLEAANKREYFRKKYAPAFRLLGEEMELG